MVTSMEGGADDINNNSVWIFPAWVIRRARQHVCASSSVWVWVWLCVHICVSVWVCMSDCMHGLQACDFGVCWTWVWLQACVLFHRCSELRVDKWWVPCVFKCSFTCVCVISSVHLASVCVPVYTFGGHLGVLVLTCACSAVCEQFVHLDAGVSIHRCMDRVCVWLLKCVCTHLGGCAWKELKVKIGKLRLIV